MSCPLNLYLEPLTYCLIYARHCKDANSLLDIMTVEDRATWYILVFQNRKSASASRALLNLLPNFIVGH